MKYWILIILCLCCYACSEEDIEEVLDPQSVPAAPPLSGVVTSVPPRIASKLWDPFWTRAELIAAIADIEKGEPDWEDRINSHIRLIAKRDRKRLYYNRYINAGGVAIVGNASVADKFFLMAKDIVLRMTKKHPNIRKQLLPRDNFYLVLLRDFARYLEMPEYLWSPQIEFDSGSCQANYCWSIVSYWHTHPMEVFVHEFAHAIHKAINGNKYMRLNPALDPTFDGRLQLAYENALELGTWRGLYAEKNYREYWAEGVEAWFYDIGPDREFPTHQAFAARDPMLAELIEEWFHRDMFWGEY